MIGPAQTMVMQPARIEQLYSAMRKHNSDAPGIIERRPTGHGTKDSPRHERRKTAPGMREKKHANEPV